jgi:hypothetical protein
VRRGASHDRDHRHKAGDDESREHLDPSLL